jgi:hypothetical protein
VNPSLVLYATFFGRISAFVMYAGPAELVRRRAVPPPLGITYRSAGETGDSIVYETCAPFGDHSAFEIIPIPSGDASFRGAPPLALTTRRSCIPFQSAVYRIDLPSGDQRAPL